LLSSFAFKIRFQALLSRFAFKPFFQLQPAPVHKGKPLAANASVLQTLGRCRVKLDGWAVQLDPSLTLG